MPIYVVLNRVWVEPSTIVGVPGEQVKLMFEGVVMGSGSGYLAFREPNVNDWIYSDVPASPGDSFSGYILLGVAEPVPRGQVTFTLEGGHADTIGGEVTKDDEKTATLTVSGAPTMPGGRIPWKLLLLAGGAIVVGSVMFKSGEKE